ncbi:unnamed protein product [Calypogeia fissa]
MAHGGYGKRRVAGRLPHSSGSNNGGGKGRDKGLRGVRKESEKKAKIVSIKNQIRSIERLLKKPLLSEVKDAQEKRLEDLKKQAELHARCELERKMSLRYRRVKFFERRKIERRIRRLEKQQRSVGDQIFAEGPLSQQLLQLKEDLEYVRFFPKTEKYVSLFMGNDDEDVKAKRTALRAKIKANLAAAVAAGVDVEETGSEDDAMEMSEDDFFMVGSSSDDADADDELTDKSPRLGEEKDDILPTPRIPAQLQPRMLKRPEKSSKKASAYPKDHRQKSARVLMPPPPRVKGKAGAMKPWISLSPTRKVVNRPAPQLARNPRAPPNISDDGKRTRSWTSSSHSSEIVKGSSTSDTPQQPKKRKRTRSKKRK